ncbi:maintenance of mitochondrial structure and function-domain-containing protein [Pelagophyceae sp. CCMP2097]|nr:maintenance of mitochondrial structure and function-domain-containing protein [Pelagophyceae sp. CCMP2097]|mmetsp:Transcript_10337/g.34213  ORF Transcript_10337/g.34213 Transcript_10337/m.34213 type:complete len:307 (+) Transcript_10337:120-1040(+)
MAAPTEGLGRRVSLHPLCIVGVSDHFTRVKVGGGRAAPDSAVVGLLFGRESGSEAAIYDAVELAPPEPVEPEAGAPPAPLPLIDAAFLLKQVELYAAVYKDRELLGWYTVAAAADEEHLRFHKAFLAFHEAPLCLMMDPAPKLNAKQLPVKVFEAEVKVLNGAPTLLFVPLQFTLETCQAERIAMEQVARTAPQTGDASLDAHVAGVDSSLQTLSERVRTIGTYLEAMAAGEHEVDYGLLRQIGSLCDQLPASGPPDLDVEFLKDYNDSLAVAYLATVTKNSNAVNDLSEKFMLVHAHARGAKGLV